MYRNYPRPKKSLNSFYFKDTSTHGDFNKKIGNNLRNTLYKQDKPYIDRLGKTTWNQSYVFGSVSKYKAPCIIKNNFKYGMRNLF